MSDPTSPENTIKFPTLEQIGTAFTNLAQGLFVAFSPFFPGSPWCLGLCGPTVGPDSALGPPFYQGPPPLDPDWFHLPPVTTMPPVTTTASLNQNSAPVSANAVSIPQISSVQQSGAVPQHGAQQSEAGQQNGRIQQNDDAIQNVVVNLSTATSVGEPPALQQVRQTGAAQAGQQPHTAQTTNGTSNQSTTTSTNRPNVAKKPTVTDDGSKFEPPQVSGNNAPRGGLAGAPNATLDESGSSRSANPSEASGSAASVQPTGSEN